MTAPRRSFQDIADKRFTVPDAFKARAILNCLVFERGTRSFGIRLVEAGIDDYKDLEGKTVDEIVTRVPTTRSNLDKVLHYFSGAGIRIT